MHDLGEGLPRLGACFFFSDGVYDALELRYLYQFLSEMRTVSPYSLYNKYSSFLSPFKQDFNFVQMFTFLYVTTCFRGCGSHP